MKNATAKTKESIEKYYKKLIIIVFKSMTNEEQEVIVKYCTKIMMVHLGTQEIFRIFKSKKVGK